MDGSFFAFALIGALLGYIVGDFQRESRYRREARANLARANQRSNQLPVSDAGTDAGTVTSSNSDSHRDGAAHYVDQQRREARRRAIRGNNGWTGANPAPAGRYSRLADASPVIAGRGWEFDGD